ncbi:hypothetical protein LN995_00900 [Pontibacter silvestris]|nr:hypothetical protein [Pontibacter silvestris]
MDKERHSCKVRGLLYGIPVLIKDNIDTADNMRTSDLPGQQVGGFVLNKFTKQFFHREGTTAEAVSYLSTTSQGFMYF